MPKIISLQGKGNCGKSVTINILRSILSENGYKPVPGMYQQHGKDFMDIYTDGTKKIGVTSRGAADNILFKDLYELIKADCDVCICACRSTGKTLSAINSFSRHSKVFLQKTHEPSPKKQPIANNMDAITLFLAI